jgi:hypothetical protein
MIASGTRANVYIETQFLYLHKFFYRGVTTFTAHLHHTMGLTRKGRKRFISLLSLETAVADAVAPLLVTYAIDVRDKTQLSTSEVE